VEQNFIYVGLIGAKIITHQVYSNEEEIYEMHFLTSLSGVIHLEFAYKEAIKVSTN
jgi:hypothetical protein